jgi:hypothetical protein
VLDLKVVIRQLPCLSTRQNKGLIKSFSGPGYNVRPISIPPFLIVKSAGSAVDTCPGQAVPCWFLNEPLLAAGLPQPQTKPINIWAALLQLQALNVSVNPPSTVKRTLFSGPAKPKLASGYLAQSIATLRNHLDITTFSSLHCNSLGVPEGMDLDPNQNFVDPYMALIKRPGSEWERMRTYMIPLIARSSLP